MDLLKFVYPIFAGTIKLSNNATQNLLAKKTLSHMMAALSYYISLLIFSLLDEHVYFLLGGLRLSFKFGTN
jgi:hypothetical protein